MILTNVVNFWSVFFLFSVNTKITRDWNLSLSNVVTFLYVVTCLCFYHIHNRLKSLKKCIIGKANFCLHQRLIVSTFFEISSNGVVFKPRMFEKHFKKNVVPTGIQACLWVDDVLKKVFNLYISMTQFDFLTEIF